MAGSVANSLLMTHPLFCRFKDRRIESAFAIYKANSSMSTLHLLMTIVLAILTVASLFIAPMFNIVVDRRSITRSTQIKIILMTFAIYGRRIYQLVRRRPMSYAGEREPGTGPMARLLLTLSLACVQRRGVGTAGASQPGRGAS